MEEKVVTETETSEECHEPEGLDQILDESVNETTLNDVSKDQTNVRTRVEQLVKSKFVGIVNELRKSSPPAVVRRWVDATPVSGPVKLTEEEEILTVNEIVVNDANCCNNQESEGLSSSQSNNSNIKEEIEPVKIDIVSHDSPNRAKIANSFTSILTKLNLRAFDKTWESSESETPPSKGITNTFSDFYEKFNSNRDRYQSIKTRKMDLKRMLSRTKVSESVNETIENQEEAIKTESQAQVSSNDAAINQNDEKIDITTTIKPDPEHESSVNEPFELLKSSNENIDWSLKPPSCDPANRRLPRANIRKIGRCASEHHATSVSVSRKMALASIGRSFSVVAPDDDHVTSATNNESFENIFVTIDEGGADSCPNPSSLQASSRSINALSDGSSLNLLSGSLPISPVHTLATSDDERSVGPPARKKLLAQDASFQSDSSYCSSVESLLDARRPDPEAILRACGFGPPRQEDVISKIPKRFLKPSQVRGIDTNEFLKRQKFANHLHETSAYGYRGLIGNPHIQPSVIVWKIRERFMSI